MDETGFLANADSSFAACWSARFVVMGGSDADFWGCVAGMGVVDIDKKQKGNLCIYKKQKQILRSVEKHFAQDDRLYFFVKGKGKGKSNDNSTCKSNSTATRAV